VSAALPPIDTALLPPDVRDGTPERRRQYDVARSFERQLVGELTKALAATAAPADDAATSAATKTYRDMLPGALADAVMAEGGLGLATQLDADGFAFGRDASQSGASQPPLGNTSEPGS
jgi:Rod binding domain-containing protein